MKKILFNDKHLLTQAVLAGQKTMTRRKLTLTLDKKVDGKLIRVYPSKVFFDNGKWLFDYEGRIYNLPKENYPRYGVGEVVAIAQAYKDIYPNADFEMIDSFTFMKESAGWTNKMFVRADLMPHHIRITDVKVERLQDISDDDCLKEGLKVSGNDRFCFQQMVAYKLSINKYFDTPRKAFAYLIDKISGNGTWESNPWVVAYSFELVKSK